MDKVGHHHSTISLRFLEKKKKEEDVDAAPVPPPPVAPKHRVPVKSPSKNPTSLSFQPPPPTTNFSTTPLLVQRFPASPKSPARQVHFRTLEESLPAKPQKTYPLPPSASSSSSTTTTTTPSPNFNLSVEVDFLLCQLRHSINEAAFKGWHFTTYRHLRSLDRLLKNTQQLPEFLNPSASSPSSSLSSLLLPKIKPIVVHIADVFLYFWTVLTAAPAAAADKPANLIHEPITDALVLLRTILNCESFSGQLTLDAYLCLVESTLPYLVLYRDGAFAGFPADKQQLALATAHRLYCFVDHALLLSPYRMDLYRPPPLGPDLVTTAWVHLYACYLEPGYSTVHTTNPFTRSAFKDENNSLLSADQIRALIAALLQAALESVVERLNDCPPLLRRLHYPSLVIELERIETLRSSRRSLSSSEQQNCISYKLLSTMSKYPSTVGGSPSLVEGDTHQRLNRLLLDVLFKSGGGGGGGGDWSSSLRRRRERGGGNHPQTANDTGSPHSPPAPARQRQRHHSEVAVGKRGASPNWL